MKLVPNNINEAVKHLKGRSMEEINQAIEEALLKDDPVDILTFLVDNELFKHTSTYKIEPIIQQIKKLDTTHVFHNHFMYFNVQDGSRMMIVNLNNYHCYIVGLYAFKEVVLALYELVD